MFGPAPFLPFRLLLALMPRVLCRSAVNKETGTKVAIKKIPKAFNDLTDAKRILREIKLMRHFRHENVREAT